MCRRIRPPIIRFSWIARRTASAPYGADAYRTSLGPSGNPKFAAANFIFVYQDARGRYESEGAFTEMTPHKDVKKSNGGRRRVDRHVRHDRLAAEERSAQQRSRRHLWDVVSGLLYDGELHRSASGARRRASPAHR